MGEIAEAFINGLFCEQCGELIDGEEPGFSRLCDDCAGECEAIDYDNRDLSKNEKRWATRLLRCLNAMPPEIEICVNHSGTVDIMNKGAGSRYIDKHGHEDNVPSLHVLIPKTRGQIDGRDSQI